MSVGDLDCAEELRAQWDTALGQLWEIPSARTPGGVHHILCGDSTKPEDVARVLAGEKARWSWTGPPYGVEYQGGTGLTSENDGAKGLPELLRGAFAAMRRLRQARALARDATRRTCPCRPIRISSQNSTAPHRVF